MEQDLLLEKISKEGRRYDLCDFNDSGYTNTYDCFIHTLDDYCETPFDTLVFNKRGYDSFYNKVDKLSVETNDFEAHFSYDVSGYYYWTTDMEESNYLCLVIEVKNQDAFLGENGDKKIEQMFEIIDEQLMAPIKRYYDFLLDRKHYLRKVGV